MLKLVRGSTSDQPPVTKSSHVVPDILQCAFQLPVSSYLFFFLENWDPNVVRFRTSLLLDHFFTRKNVFFQVLLISYATLRQVTAEISFRNIASLFLVH